MRDVHIFLLELRIGAPVENAGDAPDDLFPTVGQKALGLAIFKRGVLVAHHVRHLAVEHVRHIIWIAAVQAVGKLHEPDDVPAPHRFPDCYHNGDTPLSSDPRFSIPHTAANASAPEKQRGRPTGSPAILHMPVRAILRQTVAPAPPFPARYRRPCPRASWAASRAPRSRTASHIWRCAGGSAPRSTP